MANILYTLLSSAKAVQNSPSITLTQDYLNKPIFNKLLRYGSGDVRLSPYTILKNSPANLADIIDYQAPAEMPTTNYANGTVTFESLSLAGSAPNQAATFRLNTCVLSNTALSLSADFNSTNISSLRLTFTGTPSDDFSTAVVEDSTIASTSTILAENPTGQVITNTGIKNLADRFSSIEMAINEATSSFDGIIAGYSVGAPLNSSRNYGSSSATFTTGLLDLTGHGETYGYAYSASTLTHETTPLSSFVLSDDSALSTDTVGDNSGLVVWFPANQMTADGIVGLIPPGSNICFEETGVASDSISVHVGMEYILKGTLTEEEYAEYDALYIKNPNYTRANAWSASTIFYSYEQVFTITAPA